MKCLLSKLSSVVLALFLISTTSITALAANEPPDVNPIHGPALVDIGSQSKYNIPDGFAFLNGQDANKLLTYSGEQYDDELVGMVVPTESSVEYEIYFYYKNEGYVSDDEGNNLDASAILDSIKEGTKQANEYRRKNGASELEVVGWQVQPNYNKTTNNLEWSIMGKDKSDNSIVLNHDVRVLGRKGYMSVKMICDPNVYTSALSNFRNDLQNFRFNDGNRYADFKKGDKVAEYGLAALVAGGATAVAAKTGLLKYLWKFLIAIGIGVVAFVGKLFGRKKEL